MLAACVVLAAHVGRSPELREEERARLDAEVANGMRRLISSDAASQREVAKLDSNVEQLQTRTNAIIAKIEKPQRAASLVQTAGAVAMPGFDAAAPEGSDGAYDDTGVAASNPAMDMSTGDTGLAPANRDAEADELPEPTNLDHETVEEVEEDQAEAEAEQAKPPPGSEKYSATDGEDVVDIGANDNVPPHGDGEDGGEEPGTPATSNPRDEAPPDASAPDVDEVESAETPPDEPTGTADNPAYSSGPQAADFKVAGFSDDPLPDPEGDPEARVADDSFLELRAHKAPPTTGPSRSAAADARALEERAHALHKKLLADVAAVNPDSPELRASSLLQTGDAAETWRNLVTEGKATSWNELRKEALATQQELSQAFPADYLLRSHEAARQH